MDINTEYRGIHEYGLCYPHARCSTVDQIDQLLKLTLVLAIVNLNLN